MPRIALIKAKSYRVERGATTCLYTLFALQYWLHSFYLLQRWNEKLVEWNRSIFNRKWFKLAASFELIFDICKINHYAVTVPLKVIFDSSWTGVCHKILLWDNSFGTNWQYCHKLRCTLSQSTIHWQTSQISHTQPKNLSISRLSSQKV